MNKIAEALQNSFKAEQGLPVEMTQEDVFEHLSALLTVGPQVEGSFDADLCSSCTQRPVSYLDT